MAQFYGEMQGNRGKTSRMGTKNDGFWAHIRGWGIGVRVECKHDTDTDSDIIYVYRTSGSNGGKSDILIATLYESEEAMVRDKKGSLLVMAEGKQDHYGVVLGDEVSR